MCCAAHPIDKPYLGVFCCAGRNSHHPATAKDDGSDVVFTLCREDFLYDFLNCSLRIVFQIQNWHITGPHFRKMVTKPVSFDVLFKNWR